MNIAGYEPLTLIDYPEHLATIVFTPGCALRCPFCHNPELISAIPGVQSPFFTVNREDEFFAFLEKRQGKLDGVVITGGEPTLQPDLLDFIHRVKSLGFLVKLDTNGIFPDKVQALLGTGLVDFWAMDIKHSKEKYHLASGRKIPVATFAQTVKLLMESGVPYEFRTTVVPGIHEAEDFLAIGEWIRGAMSYHLQAFRPGKIADPSLIQKIEGKSLDLQRIRQSLLPFIATVGIRE